MLFRYVNSTLWTVKGRISKAFAKGPKTTSWIWNIHAGAHDFDALFQVRKYTLITRKVFSANLGHLSVVFFWLTGLHFSGAYFSNYDISLRHPSNPMGSFGTLVNARVSYFEGIYITSGLFQLWRSEGILTQIGLKSACTASLLRICDPLLISDMFHLFLDHRMDTRTLILTYLILILNSLNIKLLSCKLTSIRGL